MEGFITTVNGYAWGPAMLVLLLGTGIFLTLGLGFLSLRRLPMAFKLLFTGFSSHGAGDIPPFRALMTSLSATIGTGNIAGVATAITLGGPGALFWMWITALFGLATKYAEGVLAVHYRERDELGGGTVVVRCTISVTASAKGGLGSPRHLLFLAVWQASV